MRGLLLLLAAAAPGAETYTYWVEPCRRPETRCEAGDPELAAWALDAWGKASGGRLRFARARAEKQARIRFYWVSGADGLYGEARPIIVNGKRGAEIRVLPDAARLGPDIAAATARDPLLRHAIVYLTCLHEAGHALGLAHTANFEDIMYSFGFGGDVREYFLRYRRRLGARGDIPKHDGLSPLDRRRVREAATSGTSRSTPP